MKTAIAMMVAGLSLMVISCAVNTNSETSEEAFRAFLKEYEAKVIPLSVESNKAYWNAALSGSDTDYDRSAQASLTLDKIHADTAVFAKVKAFRDGGRITDPVLKRQLDVIYLSYLGNQIDPKILEELINRATAIEQKFNTYRVTVGGRSLSDNQVDSLLRYSNDSAELEEAWNASKLIGREVAEDIIALAKIRNQAATSVGFANFFEMQLKLSEQEPDEILALFDSLEILTHDVFVDLKGQIDSVLAARYQMSLAYLRPWHYQNRFFQEAPAIYDVNLDAFYQGQDPVALSRDYFAGIGLPVDTILAHSDLYERHGKYQHAQSFDMDKSGDVRIMCNVRPDYYWTNTMLHELGHAVYDYYNDRGAPWLLRGPAHSLTTEAIANFFGRLGANPQWLMQVVGAPKNEVEKVADDCTRTFRLEQLVFSRWAQVMVRFERAFYENPDQDLNTLWWDLVEKYQGLGRLEGRNEPDWASKIHIATAPVYYHNYLMGELFASQLAATISSQVLNDQESFRAGFTADSRIGKFFVEKIFVPGNRYTWNEMIERATGEKLTPRHYARQFVEMKK